MALKFNWLDRMEIENDIQGMANKIAEKRDYSTKEALKNDVRYLKELVRELEKSLDILPYESELR